MIKMAKIACTFAFEPPVSGDFDEIRLYFCSSLELAYPLFVSRRFNTLTKRCFPAQIRINPAREASFFVLDIFSR